MQSNIRHFGTELMDVFQHRINVMEKRDLKMKPFQNNAFLLTFLFVLIGVAVPEAFTDTDTDLNTVMRSHSLEFVSDESYDIRELREAVDDMRHQLVKTDKAADAMEWAKEQHAFGLFLRISQEQHAAQNPYGIKAPNQPSSQICGLCRILLQESISAFRAALEVRSRENAPENWAETQYEMGRTLLALGDLESDIERLKEASAAFRESLNVYDRKKNPESWSSTQLYLGETLQRLGVRISGDAGRQHLEKSIDAYQEALKVYTQKSENWSSIQNNYGNTLAFLYEWNDNQKHLQTAVAAFRASLEAVNRDMDPWTWAATQNNLGNVLQKLGRLKKNKTYLKEALDAYRASLTIRTQKTDVLLWAGTLDNLAQTLRVLGMLESGTASSEYLKEALSIYRTLIEFTDQEQLAARQAFTLMDMSNTMYELGYREKDIAKLEEAIDVHLKGINMLAGELPQIMETIGANSGVKAFPSGIPPMLWAQYLIDFADKLYYSAEILGSGTRWLDEAATIYKRVWNLYDQLGSGATRMDIMSVEIKQERVEKLRKKRLKMSEE